MRSLCTILARTAVITTVVTGCGPQQVELPDDGTPKDTGAVSTEPDAPTPGQRAEEAFNALRTELMELHAAGDTNAILARLKVAMDEAPLAPMQDRLFVWWLAQKVERGDIEDARAAYLKVMREKPQHALMAFNVIPAFYDRTSQPEALLDWLDELADLTTDTDLLTRTWDALLRVYASQAQFDVVAARVPELLDSVPDDVQRHRLLQQVVRSAIRAKRFDAAHAVLDAVREQAPLSDELAQFITMASVDLLLAQEHTDEAAHVLWEAADTVPDTALAAPFRRLMRARLDSGDDEAVARLVRRAINDLGDKRTSRDVLLSVWVRAAGTSGDHREFLSRLERSLDAKVDLGRLLGAFEEGFYAIMSVGTPALQQDCITLLDRMRAVPYDRDTVLARLALLRLDAAFYRKDFGTALKVIHKGVPGYDDAWHEVLSNKISAHLALQEGRHEDAIRHFRAHMETVSDWEDPERDPETGLMMVKEAVLGYNEKRIGDIYASIDRHDKAKAAYQAARDWYEKALQEVDADSEEYKGYRQELAAVPGGG